MIERFLDRTTFESYDDFMQNFRVKVPENFNFGYDVVDAWADEDPDKVAMLWTDDHGRERRFTFADMRRESDRTASFFQSLGIGRGDMVMLILKRHYEFWFSIIALHKLGAVAFVLVSFSLCDFYRVPWPVWRDMAQTYGRKYVKQVELAPYEVPATAGYIKFLHGIVGQAGPTPAECEETNGQQTDRGGHEAEAAGQV